MKRLACIKEDDSGAAFNVENLPDKVSHSPSLVGTNSEMLSSEPMCDILVLEIDESEHDSSIVEHCEKDPSEISIKAESANRDPLEKHREAPEDLEANLSVSRRKTRTQQMNSTSVNSYDITSPPSPGKRRRATTKLEGSPTITKLSQGSRGCRHSKETNDAPAIGGVECVFSEDDYTKKPARRRTKTGSSPQAECEKDCQSFPLGEAMHALSFTSVPRANAVLRLQSHREADSTCDKSPSSRLQLHEGSSSPSGLFSASELVLTSRGTTSKSSVVLGQAKDQIQPLGFASLSSAATSMASIAQESLSLQHQMTLDETFGASTKQIISKKHFGTRQPLQEILQPKAPATISTKAQVDNKTEPLIELSFPRAEGLLDLGSTFCNLRQPSLLVSASTQDAVLSREQQTRPRSSSKGLVLDQLHYQSGFREPNCRNRRKILMKGHDCSRQNPAIDPLYSSVRPAQAPIKHCRQEDQEHRPSNCLQRMVGTRRLGKAFDPNGPDGLLITKHPLSKLLRLRNNTEQDAGMFAIPEIVITPPSPTESVSQEAPAAREDLIAVNLPSMKRENSSGPKIAGEVLLQFPNSSLPSSTVTTRTVGISQVSRRGCEDTQIDIHDATGLSLFKVQADSILSESLRQTHAGQSFDIARRLLQFLVALMDPVPTFPRRSALPQPWQEKYGLVACRIPSLSFQITTEFGSSQVLLTPTRAKERLLSMLQQVLKHIVTGIVALLEDDRAPYDSPLWLACLCQVIQREVKLPTESYSSSLKQQWSETMHDGKHPFLGSMRNNDTRLSIDPTTYLDALRDIDPSALFLQSLESNLKDALQRGEAVRARTTHLLVSVPRRVNRKKAVPLSTGEASTQKTQRESDIMLASSGRISEREFRSRERKRAALGCPRDIFVVPNYVRFVGELYRVDAISFEMIQIWLRRFLFDTVHPDVPSLYELEVGCALLITVGEALERDVEVGPRALSGNTAREQASEEHRMGFTEPSRKNRSDQAPEGHWICTSSEQIRQNASAFLRCCRESNSQKPLTTVASETLSVGKDPSQEEASTTSISLKSFISSSLTRSDSIDSSSFPSSSSTSTKTTSPSTTSADLVEHGGKSGRNEDTDEQSSIKQNSGLRQVASEVDLICSHKNAAKRILEATMQRLEEIADIEEIDVDARLWCREVVALRARGWKTAKEAINEGKDDNVSNRKGGV